MEVDSGDCNDSTGEQEISDPFIRKLIRNMMRPKTAQAILQIVYGGFTMDNIVFDRNTPPHEQSGVFHFNNVCYYALAQNRRLVKTRLAEQIFRDMVVAEMRNIVSEAYPDVDNPMKLELDVDVIFANENFPLHHVVSYALHKLQGIWSVDGYSVPDYRPKPKKHKQSHNIIPAFLCSSNNKQGIDGQSEDPNDTNPTCLLFQLHPRARYEEQPLEQDGPNSWFMYKVTVDTREFIGEARSKKQARRIAAAKACFALFGIRFPELDGF